jgi:catechol 2,3-dioxygenase-like lactoylglutathione lyase family enzyme
MALPVLGVAHVNVNCADLARSLAFYRDLVGLTPLTHTHPPPQDGGGFGLPGRVEWDAYLLHDERGLGGPALDLLEWKLPKPVGRPHPGANALGMFRLCLSVPDVEATYARLAAAGVPCLSRPVSAPIDPASGLSVRFFCARDPDGTTIEFLEAPRATPREAHAELVRAGVTTSPPVWLELGPEVPVPGLWALFLRDPDGTCLELIQRPEPRAR